MASPQHASAKVTSTSMPLTVNASTRAPMDQLLPHLLLVRQLHAERVHPSAQPAFSNQPRAILSPTRTVCARSAAYVARAHLPLEVASQTMTRTPCASRSESVSQGRTKLCLAIQRPIVNVERAAHARTPQIRPRSTRSTRLVGAVGPQTRSVTVSTSAQPGTSCRRSPCRLCKVGGAPIGAASASANAVWASIFLPNRHELRTSQ
mmetsp:Transcript_31070/g.81368  ORF Transcript_31070/g.81368 Transcript_31070/m.81368 type:complete len:206 (-) Transcript_31070:1382-1999(-)